MVTELDVKLKRVAVLTAQKALSVAQSELTQTQLQKQIDELSVVETEEVVNG